MLNTLELIKTWNYEPDDKYSKEDEGKFSLALINREKKTATARLTKEEEFEGKYGFFHHCAEEFGKVFTEKSYSILFVHAKGLSENISKFIGIIEDLLKVPNKDKTRFYKTSRETFTAIKVSKFWAEGSDTKLKRRLFLNLVRSGRNYDPTQDGNNIWPALQSSKNTKSIIPGLELFIIDGYCQFTQKSLDLLAMDMHWGPIYALSGKTKEQIKNVWLSIPNTTKSLL